MRRNVIACACIVVAGFAAGCDSVGGGSADKKTFGLQYCDADSECGAAFECSPVFCADKCLPDGSGKCLACNDGKMGRCMPKPDEPCGEGACPAGQVCVTQCTGACFAPDSTDPNAGQCVDVGCAATCVEPPMNCQADGDCGAGFHCESMCATGCAEPMPMADAAGGMAKRAPVAGCIAPPAECFGTCVKDPPPPVKCNADADCPAGEVCSGVLCPAMCAPDASGGCMPCNDGWFGTCIPKPQQGCASDAECPAGFACQQYCTGMCDSFAPGCGSVCFGECVPRNTCAAIDCGPGYECREVCTACAGGTPQGASFAAPRRDDPTEPPPCGECFAQCVPVGPQPAPCNADADCPAGAHCEPVFCTMECIPDRKGGCLPCNGGFIGQCVDDPVAGCKSDADCAAGETCQTYCMGLCDPAAGCGVPCQGVCVPSQAGCASDTDCGAGQHCEWLCTDACAGARGAPARRARDEAPPDCTGSCFGQCVQDPVEPMKCNADDECGPGFRCEMVFCIMGCAARADGGVPTDCLPCNDGFLGVCTPDPTSGCADDTQCAAGETCQVYCTGACDPTMGCTEVCQGVCVPAQDGCGSDADCPAGFACESVCPPCAGGAAPDGSSGADPSFAPPCVGGPCVGQCVPAPVTCGPDAPCPAGMVCQEQAVCPPCVYSEPACEMACMVESACVPAPTGQCKQDSDCQPWQSCAIACPVTCTPQGCDQACVGQCMDKPD